MADPRVVNGFRPLTKELIYQIVIERSHGCRLWDIDGNEYVDVLNGFGMNLFGWQPDFVRNAIHEQLERGYEIGPQHPLAGEVAELICEVTGFDRAAFCNTGSEAVMGAMRIARTVTGRSTIAIFTGAYHGIFDEVIVRGTRKLKRIPAAPGIMPRRRRTCSCSTTARPSRSRSCAQRADELAAILVEPVQSRRPDFQPREFLHELRALTEQSRHAAHLRRGRHRLPRAPGGAQALFGIQADLASYGKVIGGGFPIGVIAGKRQFMDALDGGHWQFGDDSMPTVGVTYFAGTFVRHPLALAAAKAVLKHLRDAGPALQERLNARTRRWSASSTLLAEVGAPIKINTSRRCGATCSPRIIRRRPALRDDARPRHPHPRQLPVLPHHRAHRRGHRRRSSRRSRRPQRPRCRTAGSSRRRAPGSRWSPRPARRGWPDLPGIREAPSTEPQREVWLADRARPRGVAGLQRDRSRCTCAASSTSRRCATPCASSRLRHDALRATFAADGADHAAPRHGAPTRARARRARCAISRRSAPPRATSSSPRSSAPRHRAVRSRARSAGPRRAGAPRRRPPRAGVHRPPHRARRLVVLGAGQGSGRALRHRRPAAARRRCRPRRRSSTTRSRAPAMPTRRTSAPTSAGGSTRFAGGVPLLDLPTDRPRPPMRTTRAGREDHVLPAELVAQVKKLGATLRRQPVRDAARRLRRAAPPAHRPDRPRRRHAGRRPGRRRPRGPGRPLRQHAAAARQRRRARERFADPSPPRAATMLDAFDHQDVTFGRVLQKLPLARDPSRLPLVSVMFNIDQALTGEGHSLPGIALELIVQRAPLRELRAVRQRRRRRRRGHAARVPVQHRPVRRRDGRALARPRSRSCCAARSPIPSSRSAGCRSCPTPSAGRSSRWNQTEVDYPRDHARRGAVRRRPRGARPSGSRFAAAARTLSYGELAARAIGDRRRAARRAASGAASASACCLERDLDLLPAMLGVADDRRRLRAARSRRSRPIACASWSRTPSSPASSPTSAIAAASAARDRRGPAVMLDDVRARDRAAVEPRDRAARRRRRRGPPRTSSTPRARPASPRACASRTARS